VRQLGSRVGGKGDKKEGAERRHFDIDFVIGSGQSCHGGGESDNLMGVPQPVLAHATG